MNTREMTEWTTLIGSLAETSKREDRLVLIAIFQFLLNQIYHLQQEIKLMQSHVEDKQHTIGG
jgi:hypothetical protein